MQRFCCRRAAAGSPSGPEIAVAGPGEGRRGKVRGHGSREREGPTTQHVFFNAGTVDRPGVACGSVVTQASAPGFRSRLAAGLHTYAQVTHTVFELLHARTAAMPEGAVPTLTEPQRRVLREGLGLVPELGSNDGIVPSLSQVWNEVICAARADHLDVVGHYDGPAEVPAHVDWLCSGIGFRRPEFERVWRSVADVLLREPPAA